MKRRVLLIRHSDYDHGWSALGSAIDLAKSRRDSGQGGPRGDQHLTFS
jgi:hypothetical protein